MENSSYQDSDIEQPVTKEEGTRFLEFQTRGVWFGSRRRISVMVSQFQRCATAHPPSHPSFSPVMVSFMHRCSQPENMVESGILLTNQSTQSARTSSPTRPRTPTPYQTWTFGKASGRRERLTRKVGRDNWEGTS